MSFRIILIFNCIFGFFLSSELVEARSCGANMDIVGTILGGDGLSQLYNAKKTWTGKLKHEEDFLLLEKLEGSVKEKLFDWFLGTRGLAKAYNKKKAEVRKRRQQNIEGVIDRYWQNASTLMWETRYAMEAGGGNRNLRGNFRSHLSPQQQELVINLYNEALEAGESDVDLTLAEIGEALYIDAKPLRKFLFR